MDNGCELLSIIVPVYNSDRFLKKCINSILNQTYSDIRIFLVDDGSTDKSGVICEEYSSLDKRVKVIHQKNMGPIAARIAGLNMARTKYITYLDADDWLDENAFETVKPFLEQDIDVVEYGYYNDKLDGTITIGKARMAQGWYSYNDIQKNIHSKMIWDMERDSPGIEFALWNKVIKREFYKRSYNLMTDCSYQLGEDSAVLLPLMCWIHSYLVLEKPLVHHRIWRTEPAPYVSCDDFFDNAYMYYCHLRKNINNIPNKNQQIEFLYMSLTDTRRYDFWKTKKDSCKYLFPFHLINMGAKIVLYGAGSAGKMYWDQIDKTKYCNIVAWIDINFKRIEDERICGLDWFNCHDEFDYIVISIRNKTIVDEIISNLLLLNVDKSKIVWS